MSEPRSPSDMATLLRAMVSMKEQWIMEHLAGRDRRPDWVITLARRDLSVLRQAEAHYAELAGEKARRVMEDANV